MTQENVDYSAIQCTTESLIKVIPTLSAENEQQREGLKAARIHIRKPGELTFAHRIDSYNFQKDILKVAMLWLSGKKKGMMLTGPTGSGKTSFFEQLSNRTGWELLNVPCHNDLEFQELLGRIVIKKDGSTAWCDGPAIIAAKRGAILNLDEVNFLRPGTLGGLNALLDGSPYLIPETGEIVTPHPDFRISATGNDVHGESAAAFRGTQRQNQAFLDRFIGEHVTYMSEADEVTIIQNQSPVNAKILEVMMETVTAIRSMHTQGSLQETLSSRVLFTWASIVSTQGNSEQKQLAMLVKSLKWTLGFRCSPSAWSDISAALTKMIKKKFPSVPL